MSNVRDSRVGQITNVAGVEIDVTAGPDHIDLMEGAEPRYVPGTTAGVLLLHDLSGTPQMLETLADRLRATGFTIDAPLLPGHGTDIKDLVHMTWDDWAAAAQLALDELESRSGPVVIAGIGMGATLACWAAVGRPQIAGIVAINPRAMPLAQEAADTFKAMMADGAEYLMPLGPDVSDHNAHVVAYDTVPIATSLSMFEAIGEMDSYWKEIDVPMLVVTSARDHRVSPKNTDYLVERVKGKVERLVLEHSFHLATIDVDHEMLEDHVVDFVQRVSKYVTPA